MGGSLNTTQRNGDKASVLCGLGLQPNTVGGNEGLIGRSPYWWIGVCPIDGCPYWWIGVCPIDGCPLLVYRCLFYRWLSLLVDRCLSYRWLPLLVDRCLSFDGCLLVDRCLSKLWLTLIGGSVSVLSMAALTGGSAAVLIG